MRKKNGLTGDNLTTLKSLVKKYSDIFRVSLSGGKAADFAPLKIKLIDAAKPVRVKLRNYSAKQKSFLSKFESTLVEN